jgi:hypothetical protein
MEQPCVRTFMHYLHRKKWTEMGLKTVPAVRAVRACFFTTNYGRRLHELLQLHTAYLCLYHIH